MTEADELSDAKTRLARIGSASRRLRGQGVAALLAGGEEPPGRSADEVIGGPRGQGERPTEEQQAELLLIESLDFAMGELRDRHVATIGTGTGPSPGSPTPISRSCTTTTPRTAVRWRRSAAS